MNSTSSPSIPALLRNEEETFGQKGVDTKKEKRKTHEEQKLLMQATLPLPCQHQALPVTVSMLAFSQLFSDKSGDYVDLRTIIACKNKSFAVPCNKSFTL